MHALIIEDQYLVASVIEEGLRELGYSSFGIASTEEQALAAANQRFPDLITADDQITNGSGIRAAQAICEMRAVPVVFIAGDTRAVARSEPNAVVLEKPFVGAQLKEAVGQALVQYEARRAAP